MSVKTTDVGHPRELKKRIGKALLSVTVATLVAAAVWAGGTVATVAGGENRSISLYHTHTKESLTVTYMQNGRYIPSAMKKINYLLRDWRRDSVVKIDPKTIDLVWELHADLGSQRPVHIVSGYRSPKTNAFLKRIGRNVAKHSQHMSGKAMDFYFPDVPTQKIRNSALVRKVGGVGYYRSSGGPTGFLHVDSGKVRHWGPRISKSQWAQINSEGRKTVGRRLKNGSAFEVASATEPKQKSGGLLSWFTGGKKKAAPELAPPDEQDINPIYAGSDDDLADLAADAAIEPVMPKAKPATPEADGVTEDDFGDEDIAALSAAVANTETRMAKPEDVQVGEPVPRPRLKPIEIMMMAAANMKIEPASAQPDNEIASASPPVVDGDSNTLEGVATFEENISAEGKSDFASADLTHVTNEVPVIRPVLAATMADDINWWPTLMATSEALLQGSEPPVATEAQTASGKGDLQVVMRTGKGNIDAAALALALN